MKIWFKNLSVLVCLIAASSLFAAEFSPALDFELDKAAAKDKVSAIVILESPIDIMALDFSLHARKATLAERHREVIEALKYNAAQTQPAFQSELDELQRTGDLTGYTAYWIENLFVIHASKDFIESLRNRSDVKYVTENFKAELIDPIIGDGREHRRNPLDTETTTPGQDAIRATQVNRELGITGNGVLVANCDTGVDGSHPALASRWRGTVAPASECWRDALGGGTTFPVDNNNHGTHVMGTITGRAISGADTITVGSAPNAMWIADNAIDQGVSSNFDNDIIDAYQWFADPDNNVNTMDDVPDVIQNSWGVNTSLGYVQCFDFWNTVVTNCEAAGPVITWSAGNEGTSGLRSPAIYSLNAYQIFSVGAVDATNYSAPYPIASFSSRGPTPCTPAEPDNFKPEICAPGVDVYSSVPGGGYNGTYSGTSMAGPHVAGVVALMREACPDCDHMTIKDAIMNTAIDYGTAGQDNIYGHGFIDAYEAVLSVSNLGRIGGNVTDGTDPLGGVRVSILSGSNQVFTDVNGDYYLALSDGTYDVVFSKIGFSPDTVYGVSVVVDDTTIVNAQLVALQQITFLNEDFETGGAGWTHDAPAGWVDQWHISTERANSGTQSYKCGDTGTGNYADLSDARLTSPVLTSLPPFAQISFSTGIESEVSSFYADSAYDGGWIEISVDAGPWTNIVPVEGYNRATRYQAGGSNPYTGPAPGEPCLAVSLATWINYTLDLSAYEGSDVQLRFRFGSDANTNREGWYVDDIFGYGYVDNVLEAPSGLTILYDGDTGNLNFNWQGNSANYRLWSGPSFDGPWDTIEGTTSNTSLTIPIPVGDARYYVVTATD